MAGGIYLLRGENDLVEMTEEPFENEDIFQVLLAKYPRVLGGDQFDRETPRRWMLVTREAPIPSEEEGPDRWSVDHLFVDEDAVPTFVEVKRSSDTRIRREVVGQMLDYVSHAIVTWRNDRLRAHFEQQCGDDDPAEVFAAAFGADRRPDEFWMLVDTNLRAGKVRLVFVADVIPLELQRIVEFLNDQMKPAEVLGIEIRQYVGGNLQTLVPRVIGQTAESQGNKGVPERGPRWTPERFFRVLAESRPEQEVELARDLLDFATTVAGRPPEWGTGKQTGSFTAKIRIGRELFSLFSVYTGGAFSINIGWNRSRLQRLAAGPQLLDKYRNKCRAALGFDFDDNATWTDLLTMALLSSLLADHASAFKQLVTELADDLGRLGPA